MEEVIQEEVPVDEVNQEEVPLDEVAVDTRTTEVVEEVAPAKEMSDVPDEPSRIEEMDVATQPMQLEFHQYLVEKEEIVEEFNEEGKLKSRKKTIYRYKLL